MVQKADAQPAGVRAHLLGEGPDQCGSDVGVARAVAGYEIEHGGRARTERAKTWSTEKPPQDSAAAGPLETRPRLGFNPYSPQQLAGIRMEPPPSLPWAIGTMPDATAAAEPPEDPPLECSLSQGFGVGPKARGSVVMAVPSSGVFVRPRITKPALLNLCTRKLSALCPIARRLGKGRALAVRLVGLGSAEVL